MSILSIILLVACVFVAIQIPNLGNESKIAVYKQTVEETKMEGIEL